MAWYDVLPWANNLVNTRVIPYSGEKDKQRQAADRVIALTESLGIRIPYVIGKNMGHRIDNDSSVIIDRQLNKWAEEPREIPRKQIDFTTYTLRYNKVGWLKITGLESHWKASRIRGRIENDGSLVIQSNGITRFEVDFRDSGWPNTDQRIKAMIDGQLFLLMTGVMSQVSSANSRKQTAGKLWKRSIRGCVNDRACMVLSTTLSAASSFLLPPAGQLFTVKPNDGLTGNSATPRTDGVA